MKVVIDLRCKESNTWNYKLFFAKLVEVEKNILGHITVDN